MTAFEFLGLGSIGLFVGVLSAFFGVGGGAFLVPALIGFGLTWPAANALSLLQMIPTSALGAWGHYKEKRVRMRLGLLTLAGSIPGAWIGHACVDWLNNQHEIILAGLRVNLLDTVLTWLFVGTIITMAGRMLLEGRRAKPDATKRTDEEVPREKEVLPLPAALLGAVVGFASAMLGIGGGFLFVPISIQLFNLPVAVAVATSLFQMPVTAATGAASYVLGNTPIPWVWLVPLLAGSLSGVRFGVSLSKKFNNKQYRIILAVMLLLISAFLLVRWVLSLHPAQENILPVAPIL